MSVSLIDTAFDPNNYEFHDGAVSHWSWLTRSCPRFSIGCGVGIVSRENRVSQSPLVRIRESEHVYVAVLSPSRTHRRSRFELEPRRSWAYRFLQIYGLK